MPVSISIAVLAGVRKCVSMWAVNLGTRRRHRRHQRALCAGRRRRILSQPRQPAVRGLSGPRRGDRRLSCEAGAARPARAVLAVATSPNGDPRRLHQQPVDVLGRRAHGAFGRRAAARGQRLLRQRARRAAADRRPMCARSAAAQPFARHADRRHRARLRSRRQRRYPARERLSADRRRGRPRHHGGGERRGERRAGSDAPPL